MRNYCELLFSVLSQLEWENIVSCHCEVWHLLLWLLASECTLYKIAQVSVT